jgi:hypothetical protein
MLGTAFLGQVVQLGLGHMFMKGTSMAHTTFLIHAILWMQIGSLKMACTVNTLEITFQRDMFLAKEEELESRGM